MKIGYFFLGLSVALSLGLAVAVVLGGHSYYWAALFACVALLHLVSGSCFFLAYSGGKLRVRESASAIAAREKLDSLFSEVKEAQGRMDRVERSVNDLAALCSGRDSDLTRRVKLIAAGVRNSELELVRRSKLVAADVKSLERSMARRFALSDRSLKGLKVEMERLPGTVANFNRLSALVFPGDALVPLPGEWAITAPCVDFLVSELLARNGLEVVVECGSGVSTVWLGAAMRHRGFGHVYAFEHLPEFSARTRWYLERNGLEDWVTVIDAPLVSVHIEDEDYNWYDVSALPSDLVIDVLLVDGPPGATGHHARFPAYPLFSSRLSDGAVVMLDDIVRDEEKEIESRWLKTAQAGVTLHKIVELPKATVFRVARAGRHIG